MSGLRHGVLQDITIGQQLGVLCDAVASLPRPTEQWAVDQSAGGDAPAERQEPLHEWPGRRVQRTAGLRNGEDLVKGCVGFSPESTLRLAN